jgi:hypothetical protein
MSFFAARGGDSRIGWRRKKENSPTIYRGDRRQRDERKSREGRHGLPRCTCRPWTALCDASRRPCPPPLKRWAIFDGRRFGASAKRGAPRPPGASEGGPSRRGIARRHCVPTFPFSLCKQNRLKDSQNRTKYSCPSVLKETVTRPSFPSSQWTARWSDSVSFVAPGSRSRSVRASQSCRPLTLASVSGSKSGAAI